MTLRACARCSAGEPGGYDDNHDAAREAMCTEFSLTSNVFAWLCHDCRQDWALRTFDEETFSTYRELEFTLDCFKWGNAGVADQVTATLGTPATLGDTYLAIVQARQ